MTFSINYLNEACNQIDSTMFSGDIFIEKENRDKLKLYIDRWVAKMSEWEQIEGQFKNAKLCD